MKGHKQRLWVLLLAVLLALGGLGIGYAHWTQSLYIAGTATIGENDPGFTGDCEFSQNPEDPDIDDDCDCTCAFTDSDSDGDYDTMEATIINVNTFCVYRLYSTILNEGTLPMRIDSVQITYSSPVMIAEEEPLVNTVLDPGDEVTLKLSIAIGAAMADTYNFSVKITSCLWNQ
jgi:hypothetical protein